MKTEIKDYIIATQSNNWKPLVENGVDTTGISIMPLRIDEKLQRPVTFLLKFEKGASYPYHNHPQGEELLVLEGSCLIEGALLGAGSYLYTPPGFKHAVKTETGCTILFMVPEEVEIIKELPSS